MREQNLAVPDFSLPLETSTLLLTRRATEIKAGLADEPWGDLLDYGETQLIPESTRTFNIGETILFTYRLYNPPQAL